MVTAKQAMETSVPHPTRSNPQTYKATSKYTSFAKTLGRVARFIPDGDRGDFNFSRWAQQFFLPWYGEHLEEIRGEAFTAKVQTDGLGTVRSTLVKYNPKNFERWNREPGFSMTKLKQVEAKLALAVLKGGKPISKEELDGMLIGISIALPEDLRGRLQGHPEVRFLSVVELTVADGVTKLGLSDNPARRESQYQTSSPCLTRFSYGMPYDIAGWVDFQLKKMFAHLRAPNAGIEIFRLTVDEMTREIEAFLDLKGIPYDKVEVQ